MSEDLHRTIRDQRRQLGALNRQVRELKAQRKGLIRWLNEHQADVHDAGAYTYQAGKYHAYKAVVERLKTDIRG